MAAATLGVVLGVACLAAALGRLMPWVLRSLPPAEPAEDESAGSRPGYAELGHRPGLPLFLGALSALTGALMAGVLGSSWQLLVLLPLAPIGALLGYVDWQARLLPKLVVLPTTGAVLLLGGIAWLTSGESEPLLRGLIGLVATRSFFWMLWRVRRVGMGFGDVRLAALLGFALAHVGWAELVVGLYSAFLLFGVPGLVLVMVKQDRGLLRRSFPFGPALLAGALIGVLVGAQVATLF